MHPQLPVPPSSVCSHNSPNVYSQLHYNNVLKILYRCGFLFFFSSTNILMTFHWILQETEAILKKEAKLSDDDASVHTDKSQTSSAVSHALAAYKR